ncbi:MAG: ThiF family adenylyltransferase [Acidiferrobacterales bacterium]
MNDEQLLRYSRQIMLPQVDVAGQETLLSSKALIIGIGGLGAPVAMYLAAAGVGELTLVDNDNVDLGNLQRQIIHDTFSIGQRKTDSAKKRLNAINPETKINLISSKLGGSDLRAEIKKSDVIIDATDNFKTRFQINAACVTEKKPLVSGAAIRMEGQVSVFDMSTNGSPCYRCLYKDDGGEENQNCTENGVLAPVVGIIGSIQACESLKILLNLGEPLLGKLLLLDATTMEWRTIKINPDPECPVCG